MSVVKVIIERQVKSGKEEELNKLLKELRIKAIRQQGYLSGETLESVKDKSHLLVISSWLSDSHWRDWESNPERQEILEKIEPLLRAPARTVVFTPI